MAALVGCTNVITHKIAKKNGVQLKSMQVRLEADLDRRGVLLSEEVDVSFPACGCASISPPTPAMPKLSG